MNRRKCLHCGEPIPKGKRADAVYCCGSCRTLDWMARRSAMAAALFFNKRLGKVFLTSRRQKTAKLRSKQKQRVASTETG